MTKKQLINTFIDNGYIIKKANNIEPSNKVHKLFCTIYNLGNKEAEIRRFIPDLKKILKEKGWDIKSDKIRLKEQGGLPRNCLIGLCISMDLSPKKEQEKEHTVPTTNNSTKALITKEVKINEVKVQKKERKKGVDLKPYIKEYYVRGKEKNVLGSNEVHNLALDFYKDNPEVLRVIKDPSNFTKKFKENWLLINPDTPLETKDSIRDPNDRNKRGIAYIKKKGS